MTDVHGMPANVMSHVPGLTAVDVAINAKNLALVRQLEARAPFAGYLAMKVPKFMGLGSEWKPRCSPQLGRSMTCEGVLCSIYLVALWHGLHNLARVESQCGPQTGRPTPSWTAELCSCALMHVGSGSGGRRRYLVVMPRWPAAGAGHLVRVVMLAYKSIDEPLPVCKARPVHLRSAPHHSTDPERDCAHEQPCRTVCSLGAVAACVSGQRFWAGVSAQHVHQCLRRAGSTSAASLGVSDLGGA